jgi:alpha,alpha-trehalase
MSQPTKRQHPKTKTGDIAMAPPRIEGSDIERALGYIEATWGELERHRPQDSETLLGLPYPYFVPGSCPQQGFIHNELYYWDTYFIALGLLDTTRHHQAFEQADNLLHLLQRFGFVPSGNRIYLTARSQPPLLSSLLLDLYDRGGSKEWLAPRMELVKKEYELVWRGTLQPHWRQVFDGLSRNYEINLIDELAEAESGWDYTTRFYGSALQYIPIDLNALLYKYEVDFERTSLIMGKPREAEQWQQRAKERREQVDAYLWNQDGGFYFDYNYQTGKQSRVWSLAGYYPLWAGMASKAQAASLANNLERFEAAGGLTATLSQPHVKEHHAAQWVYPNGWAPLHLLIIRGLADYGYEMLAQRLARRWLYTNLHSFNRHGAFFEKYNVVDLDAPPKDGVYPSQTGFGWTNAVFAVLARDYAHTLGP